MTLNNAEDDGRWTADDAGWDTEDRFPSPSMVLRLLSSIVHRLPSDYA
jgi:hypothetical protein